MRSFGVLALFFGVVAIPACTKPDDEKTCPPGEAVCGTYVCDATDNADGDAAGEDGAAFAQSDLARRAATGVHPTTYVSLTFDDTFADQYQLRKIFDEVGLKATFYVNSARIGEDKYLTEAQVQDLASAGHEIAGHTVTHPWLTAVDEAEQRRQICNDRAALVGRGLRVTSLAYPHGAFSPLTQQIARDCGYNSARVVGTLDCSGCASALHVEPANTSGIDAFAILTAPSNKCDATAADLENQVLAAENSGGGWVPMVFHHVCQGCGRNAVPANVLREFFAWLAARAPHTQVKTVAEMIGGEMQPPVTIAAPQEVATGSNILPNPGLEDAEPSDKDMSRCWIKGGEGDNHYDYGRTNDAHSGAWAQWLKVKALASGARRVLSRQDLGFCTPEVKAGHTYRVSTFYKSNVPPRFTVYYRRASGFFDLWLTGRVLPRADDWHQESWTLPPLPADASGISVALSIQDVGTLTMDDWELVDTTP